MTVNLEGFLLLNALMNIIALICAGRLSGLRLKWARALAVSACATIYAVLAYLPGLEMLQGFPRLLVPIGMGVAAFAPAQPGAVARGSAWLCGSTFLLGGTGYGLMGVWGMRGYTLPLALVTLLVGGVAAVTLFNAIKRARLNVGAVDVCVEACGKSTRIKGIVDTGNHLTEPISGLPVIIIGGGQLQIEQKDVAGSTRPVAFRSIGGDGLLDAFVPDSLTVNGRPVRNAYVAIAEGAIDKRYGALIPAGVVATRTKANGGETYGLV